MHFRKSALNFEGTYPSTHSSLFHKKQQRCNRGEIFGATSAMVGQNLPSPGWNRVKASENLGATAVAPVAPAVTSLGIYKIEIVMKISQSARTLHKVDHDFKLNNSQRLPNSHESQRVLK